MRLQIYDSGNSPIQKRIDRKFEKKKKRPTPYFQTVREGNTAFPVFEGLKNKPVSQLPTETSNVSDDIVTEMMTEESVQEKGKPYVKK